MKTLLDVLGISVVEITPDHVELTMPISGDVLQEWGFLHGGATLALLESAASYGAAARTDPAVERPFGINLDVTHRKSGKLGGPLLRKNASCEAIALFSRSPHRLRC